MKKILITMFALVSIGTAGAAVVAPSPVFADAKSQICGGIGAAEGGGCTNSNTRITQTIRNVVGLLSIIIGVVAVIMIVIAGFKYITSGGDASSIQSAKNTLIYAIVGLVIVAMSQFIVQFVLKRAADTAKNTETHIMTDFAA